MITTDQILGWLNYPASDKHHLDKTDNLIKDLKSAPESDLEKQIEGLKTFAQGSTDGLCLPEVFIHIGIEYYRRGIFEKASQSFNEAINKYPNDDTHHQALAYWLAGMADRQNASNQAAYNNWQKARKLFDSQMAIYKKEIPPKGEEKDDTPENDKKLKWHQERLREMNVALAFTAEEVYDWLNKFEEEKSALSKEVDILRQKISSFIRSRRFAEARSKLVEIQNICVFETNQPLEFPDVLVFCGLAEYQMGNPKEAGQILRKTLSLYTPRTHRYAVVRWMLGIFLGLIPAERTQAVKFWRLSANDFRELELAADYRNLDNQRIWYKNTRAIMQLAIEERVSTLP